MNQEQRKFLIEQVNKTYNSQVQKLEEEVPQKPSLNNYLIAAFLDNTIQFNDIGTLKTKMREMVLKYGTSDRLVYEDESWNRRKQERDDIVHVIAEDLFILPQSYIDALKEYEKKKKKIDQEIKTLEAAKNTIIMKIQIGSSATMDRLVMQIDDMGDLNLLNNQLILADNKKELPS